MLALQAAGEGERPNGFTGWAERGGRAAFRRRKRCYMAGFRSNKRVASPGGNGWEKK